MTDSTSFISQFGDSLLNSSDGTTVSPSTALSGKNHILLYFSAKWCGPCRMFTPGLIEFYNKVKESKNIEVVFCSLDNDEDQYKEYTSKMPWLSMPFDAKETKAMARTYNARGIPHLVVVDGETFEVVTYDGTEGLRENEDNFPWKPKTFAEVWPEKVLASKDSSEKFLDSATLKDKYVMLYFSAHWCPPCRMFTPKLSEAYTKLKAERDDFEMIFISSDRNEDAFNEYFDTMSFCALPYEHREAKAVISKQFEVEGIPTLVMLGPVSDESGNRPLINKNIRSFMENEEFSEFPFHKKNYGSVDMGAGDLNDTKSLVILHENGDDDEQNDVKKVAQEVASKNKDINILWSFSEKGLGPRIRALTKLPGIELAEDPAMILLDIPDDGGYYKTDVTDITVESVMAFIENPGERQQLE
mmetsp:Transcript_15593/g.19788  ORF Transcript_15593/g.19788 Transcript_15593/m.19788 type:complete len:415 (-) Transcript_15593:140-1384(-)|eukprot:CAMPEP_0203635252 /NCGR_PEP_ID=MMETSP0088-20131115/2063_1 /ASSEMBLY_ACC=CAM_ASM_001087 /TAXON_ID=426623 /ORGANISM="Chaetoceros affinis, Strain CCMP159" /LENGTH=414 /DNA_ID=CAMNT_0050489075 /DNA_START=65 /DNA_END=1309 /DNA_ORIENTATION=+